MCTVGCCVCVSVCLSVCLSVICVQVGLAIALPTRSLSRAWGWVASLRVPEVIRRPVYGAFVWATGANMEEALKADIKEYESLVDLFKRKIKSELRPISTDAALVSP